MAIEESLKPRIKVIERWPGMDKNKYYVGQIITLPCYERSSKQWFIQDGESKIYDAYFDNYPHLFKRLEWWEEMDEKDMPEYVKHKIDAEVYKLKKQAETTPSDAYCIKRSSIESESYYQWLSLYDLLPATYEEYEQYLQSQK